MLTDSSTASDGPSGATPTGVLPVARAPDLSADELNHIARARVAALRPIG